ncbi:MAG: pectin acetylesterase-family hydrolase [Ilumatobacteraceae bacterium]
MTTRTVRRSVAMAVVAVMVAAACSSDDAAPASEPPVTAASAGEPTTAAPSSAPPATTAASTTAAPTTDATAAAIVPDQWTAVDPGPGCMCMDGSPFELWDRSGDPIKVVLYFEGGGACFSAETCNFANSTATVNLQLGRPPAGIGGLFDQTNPENPIAGHSMVYVPYCSGDVHIGNKTTEYAPDLTVHHNGYVNATAGLDHLIATYPDVEELLVMGASAGAVPTPLFAALAADELPDARVTTFGDSAGAYPDVPAVNASIGAGLWGTDTIDPGWPEYASLTPEQRSIPGLYVVAGEHNPDISFGRFDFAFDEVPSFFGSIAGFEANELVTLIDQTAAQIESSGVPLATYVAPGTLHTIVGRDEFYTTEVEGVRLVDWFTAQLHGQPGGGPPSDVHCVECTAP